MRYIKSIALNIFNIKLKLKRSINHDFDPSLGGTSSQHPKWFGIALGIRLAEFY